MIVVKRMLLPAVVFAIVLACPPSHAAPLHPVAKPAATAPSPLRGSLSYDLTGTVVDGAAPTVRVWSRVDTTPVNRVRIDLNYTALGNSYLSEFAVRVRHEPTGVQRLVGGAAACVTFGPCDATAGWAAAPGTRRRCCATSS